MSNNTEVLVSSIIEQAKSRMDVVNVCRNVIELRKSLIEINDLLVVSWDEETQVSYG